MTARPEKGPFNRRDSEAWEGDNCVPVFFSGEMCEQMGNKQCLLCLHTTQSILHLYILRHMSYFKKACCLCLCNYHLLAFTVCFYSMRKCLISDVFAFPTGTVVCVQLFWAGWNPSCQLLQLPELWRVCAV